MPERESLPLNENSREISFGDVFTTDSSDRHRYWIVSRVSVSGNERFFSAGPIMIINGREHLGVGATSTPDDIKEIVDHWNTERVIAAIEREWRRQYPRTTTETHCISQGRTSY